MAIEKVRNYLKKFNAQDRILEFAESSATVELAAKAAGTQPERIAKSLTFMVNDTPIMIVAAGDAKVDNGKYKAEYATKAKMLTAQQVDELIGHGVGGVCPFAVGEGTEVSAD
ncbi:MAG: YbaK/EbsC family protein, partial [Acidaminococcaceae bacterium]|nr:YbaK/EbsC family protein [Acidaminococcaceae bacterium]